MAHAKITQLKAQCSFGDKRFVIVMSRKPVNLDNLTGKLETQPLCLPSCDRAALLTKSGVHFHTFGYISDMKAPDVFILGLGC
jgi:hypothetical protein